MKKSIIARYLVLFVVFGLLPMSASAATVYLDSSRTNVSVGDTLVVSVKVNAEGVSLNTVEGDVAIKSGGKSVSTQEFSLANSAFGLWPRTPSLSSDGLVASFVGGVPGGFNIEGATLFRMVMVAKREGTVTIAPQNIIAYANDGSGTKVPVTMKGVTLNVVAKKSGVTSVDDWTPVVAGDTTPPQDFIVVLGQDKTMFDNKKFAYFSAVDNQSGISYYDVSENGATAVRSGSVYVLQDQSGSVKLSVTAYDKAGNKKVAIYPSSGTSFGSFFASISWISIILVILVILIAWYAVKKVWKSKQNVPTISS